MIKTIQFTKTIYSLKRILLYATVVFFALVFVSCFFYLLHGHNYLATWYTSLNSCFYKSQVWNTDFFTPGIKSDGNMYCIIAMIIVIIGSLRCISLLKKQKKNEPAPLIINYNTADLIPVLICLIATTMLWQYGNRLALPASDEVFSAQNVAGSHPFQAVSYYMLPNNHLFFNLLNNIVFHFVADKIFTGRLISLLAYASCIILIFFWLKNIFRNRWLALLACITLSLQFQVWGFSFQARGYELYLLAEWGMFLSLFAYINSNNEKWLRLNALCSAIGFFCLPSFLYFFLAQSVFMLLYWLVYKKKDAAFWKYQVVALAFTYLCYLPALCFSGLEAIARNNYVAPMNAFKNTGRTAFIQWMFPYFKPYITHIFSDLHWNNLPISLILFFLPLLLLFSRKNKNNLVTGMFYAGMWLTFFVVAITMKKLPFERNLTGHYSLTLAAVVLVAYRLTDLLAMIGKTAIVKWVLFPGIILLFAFHFIRTNELFLKDTLYEYDVNALYKEKSDWLSFIPPGSTVAFSDADFYSYFICKKIGYKVSKCPGGNETYYVKEADENIPEPFANKYILAKKNYGNEIWKLK